LSAIGEVRRIFDFLHEMVGLKVVVILFSHAFGVDGAGVRAKAAKKLMSVSYSTTQRPKI
jgi:hypothetical protein